MRNKVNTDVKSNDDTGTRRQELGHRPNFLRLAQTVFSINFRPNFMILQDRN